MPKMSPGSAKLLRELEARRRAAAAAVTAAAEGEAGGGEGGALPGEASQAGPLGGEGPGSAERRTERRLRTIFEMYRECTFTPQVAG